MRVAGPDPGNGAGDVHRIRLADLPLRKSVTLSELYEETCVRRTAKRPWRSFDARSRTSSFSISRGRVPTGSWWPNSSEPSNIHS